MDRTKADNLARKIAKDFDLGHPEPLRFASNYLYKAGDRVIRVSRKEAGEEYLKEQVDLALFLSDRDFPTSRPVYEKVIEKDNLFVTLWQFIEGEGDGSLAHPYSLGLLLKRFHRETADYQGSLPQWSFAEGAGARESEKFENNQYLTDKDIAILEKRAAEFRQRVKEIDFSMPSGVIHGDFSLGNIITSKGIPYLIDFDRACRGPREWDVAHPLHTEIFFGKKASEDFFLACGAVRRDELQAIAYMKAIFTMAWLCSQENSPWKKEETVRRMRFWRDPNSDWLHWRPPPQGLNIT